MMKILNTVTFFTLFAVGCRGSQDPFKQEAGNSNFLYTAENIAAATAYLNSLAYSPSMAGLHYNAGQNFSAINVVPDQHSMSGSAPGMISGAVPNISRDESMTAGLIGGIAYPFASPFTYGLAGDGCRPFGEQIAAMGYHEEPEIHQYTELTSASTSAFRPFIGEKRNGNERSSSMDRSVLQFMPESKKKKEEEVPIEVCSTSQQEEEEIIDVENIDEEMLDVENIDEDSLHDEQLSCSDSANDKEERTRPDVGIWNDRRFYNSRRRGYKTNTGRQYGHSSTDENIKRLTKSELYKERLEKRIEKFYTNVAPVIDDNSLWYFIARGSTAINTKYRDLFGLQEILKRSSKDKHRKMLESLGGYYAGIFDDLIEYMKNKRPMCSDSENLGDIYIREDLMPNRYNLKEDDIINKIDKKYHALAYAVRMVTKIPEVYVDFSNITAEFIQCTYTLKDSDKNEEHLQVLLKMLKIVQVYLKEKLSDSTYSALYNIFERLYGKNKMEKLTTVELYKEIYVILAEFYENAELIYKQKKYVLAGKYIMANQKYMKCQIRSKIEAAEKLDKRVKGSNYSPEYNKWDIAPDIRDHYHVLCVDNTTGQPRKLCMPLYKDKKSGELHCLHTVNDTVDHIKALYTIEEKQDIIHPFKVKKGTNRWTYIQEKERAQTVKDLEGYEVVFYRIHEDLEKEKFTFADFKHLKSYDDNSIRIPLFFKRLMLSAADLGPYDTMGSHTVLNPAGFIDRKPSIYKYNSNYKGMEYTDVQNYYKNLYIPEKERKGFDCYIMDCKCAKKEDNTVEAEWYVKMPSSVNEYTHCILSESFREKENSEKFNELVEVLESREYNKDSTLQGFWLSNSYKADSPLAPETPAIFNILPSTKFYHRSAAKTTSLEKIISEIKKEEAKLQKKAEKAKKSFIKKNLDDLYDQLYTKLSKRPEPQADFIVFRNVNSSKSNIGVHNEILDIFISWYRTERLNLDAKE
ncbi:hypothetical protein NEMIN01_2115 [Nematocida minor]|uniref:uncharacterized protein n=1 Tax=Nematocida minor TaxID=1912983 RepID=UPI00221EACE7|nr:uncharacterized protein NEMIN01_2115 [Nematocida minor]KAI5192616.1 hypothetical protein NEMIN01_2115 [Nematocida minor]